MTDLPQPAVEHLYPFLVLAVVVVGLLAGILTAVVKGIRDLKSLMRSEIRASYADDDDGKPGIAAVMTRKIVQEAFSANLDHISRSIQDIERVQEELASNLKQHEEKEFERADRRDRDLKSDVSRAIDTALRYPKELANQCRLVRETVGQQGKQIDSHEHRLRVLEAK